MPRKRVGPNAEHPREFVPSPQATRSRHRACEARDARSSARWEPDPASLARVTPDHHPRAGVRTNLREARNRNQAKDVSLLCCLGWSDGPRRTILHSTEPRRACTEPSNPFGMPNNRLGSRFSPLANPNQFAVNRSHSLGRPSNWPVRPRRASTEASRTSTESRGASTEPQRRFYGGQRCFYGGLRRFYGSQ